MADIINPLPESAPSQTAAAQSVTQDATSSSMAVGANAPKSYTAATSISSLSDLKEKAPEVYQKMMEGIAMSIIGQMKDHEERRRKITRDAERDS